MQAIRREIQVVEHVLRELSPILHIVAEDKDRNDQRRRNRGVASSRVTGGAMAKHWIWRSLFAGLCGAAAHSALMAFKSWSGLLPAFQPYATMTQKDVDDCGKDITASNGKKGFAVFSD